MKITKEELLIEYKRITDNIADECDWVTHFTGKEVCYHICQALKNLNFDYFLSSKELYIMYSDHIDSLNISKEEWYEKYGVPEIVDMIHDLITQSLKNLDSSSL